MVAIFLLWLLPFCVLERTYLLLSCVSSFHSYGGRCGVQNVLSICAFVEWSVSLRFLLEHRFLRQKLLTRPVVAFSFMAAFIAFVLNSCIVAGVSAVILLVGL